LFEKISNTIVGGELLPDKVFLDYDCLLFEGSAQLQNKNYSERNIIVHNICVLVSKLQILSARKKEFTLLTKNNFFSVLKNYLDSENKQREKNIQNEQSDEQNERSDERSEQNEQNDERSDEQNEQNKEINEFDYPTDGVIFTPHDSEYFPAGTKLPYYKRTLVQLTDVCKWKREKDLTIDFQIINGEMMTYDKDKNKNVVFTGTDSFPFTSDNIISEEPLSSFEGLVVEFEPKYQINGIYMTPRKIRFDKNGANKLTTAVNIWEYINDPITEDDLLGNSMKLVRQYHNKVKQSLYYRIPEKSVILDIGSGRGGDIYKWIYRKLRVLGVEPNPENREEFYRRLMSNKFLKDKKDDFTLFVGGGENTTDITHFVKENNNNKKVDAITLMLSLSFFWQTEKHLDALINTIYCNLKPGGKLYYFTIDGDSLEQLFEPAFKNIKRKKVELIGTTILLQEKPKKLFFGRKVLFDIPGTIVENQTEYVVRINDLNEKLTKLGFEEITRNVANDEMLLSKEQKIFTNLYTYGEFVKGKEEIPCDNRNIDLSLESNVEDVEDVEIIENFDTKVNTSEKKNQKESIQRKSTVKSSLIDIKKNSSDEEEKDRDISNEEEKDRDITDEEDILDSIQEQKEIQKEKQEKKLDKIKGKSLYILPLEYISRTNQLINNLEYVSELIPNTELSRHSIIFDGCSIFHAVLSICIQEYKTITTEEKISTARNFQKKFHRNPLKYLSSFFEVNIEVYIFRNTLILYQQTKKKFNTKILLLKNKNHYETISMNEEFFFEDNE